MSATADLPYSILLPPGWARIIVDDDTEAGLSKVVDGIVAEAPPERRGPLGDMLRRTAHDALEQAKARGALELILSFASVQGLPIPVSIVVFPVPEPEETGRSADEFLLSLARPGSRAVEIDGVAAIRRPHDSSMEEGAVPYRAINYIVRHPYSGRWLMFTASILTSSEDGYEDVLEALEALIDAMLSTVRFRKIGDPS